MTHPPGTRIRILTPPWNPRLQGATATITGLGPLNTRPATNYTACLDEPIKLTNSVPTDQIHIDDRYFELEHPIPTLRSTWSPTP
jgi:hypothetical protein